MKTKRPLVYSCSGCSSGGQMTNLLALWLDRDGMAEMSCGVGVGGAVTGLVRTAQSSRRILALDGCELSCMSACLQRAGISADTHVVLTDCGVIDRRDVDFDTAEARAVYRWRVAPAACALAETYIGAGDEELLDEP